MLLFSVSISALPVCNVHSVRFKFALFRSRYLYCTLSTERNEAHATTGADGMRIQEIFLSKLLHILFYSLRMPSALRISLVIRFAIIYIHTQHSICILHLATMNQEEEKRRIQALDVLHTPHSLLSLLISTIG